MTYGRSGKIYKFCTGFCHYYRLVHVEHTEKAIDGLHLVFVELPKVNPHTYSEKKMQVLWLRYLTEIDEHTRHVPAELLANPEVKKALYNSGMRKGMQRGLQQGMQKGFGERPCRGKGIGGPQPETDEVGFRGHFAGYRSCAGCC